jgi:hypothetical protein
MATEKSRREILRRPVRPRHNAREGRRKEMPQSCFNCAKIATGELVECSHRKVEHD